ncbi:MAG TPA: metalloregulator ArsR/SmtB family transcription factor, partial [Vicinamibacteria bacterium]
FGALSDPTRRAILARLALGEATVSELAEPFAMSLPAVLKHLGTLEQAGLVAAQKDGRVRRCRLETTPLEGALSWVERYKPFWEERFDALDEYLRATGKEEKRWRQAPPRVAKKAFGSRSPAASRRRASGSSRPSRARKV